MDEFRFVREAERRHRGGAALAGALSLILAIAALCSVRPARADDPDMPPVTYPAIPASVASRADLVPAGWKLEAEASGDLDHDGRPDLAVVIRSEKPDLSFDGHPLRGPRMLIVAFGAAPALNDGGASQGGYERVVANHTLIPRTDNPNADDYFDAETHPLQIRRGELSVALTLFLSMGGWDTWTNTFTFVWKKDRMELARFEGDSTNRGSGVTTLTIADYGRRRLTVTTGSIENDLSKTRKRPFPKGEAPTLASIGDGISFQPVPDR